MRILLVVAVALGVILLLGRDQIGLQTLPSRLVAYLFVGGSVLVVGILAAVVTEIVIGAGRKKRG